ncbi:MAG: DUF3540 domain-containing protein [Candidatus Accumulibacter sp.]|jgi:hypothetical protein|nr:DUF3540 domain-containing protein [Accumulibacter sp.]
MTRNIGMTPAFPGERALVEGVVQMTFEMRVIVASSVGILQATRAAGCLLPPEAGDRVLVAPTDGNAWVLCVLERDPERAATLALPARTAFSAETLEIDAGRLALKGGESVRVEAPVLFLTGKLLAQSFEFVRNTAVKLVESVFHRRARYAKNREENTETLDVAAERMRIECRHSARLRAENVDLKAEHLLDMDGEHIKLG